MGEAKARRGEADYGATAPAGLSLLPNFQIRALSVSFGANNKCTGKLLKACRLTIANFRGVSAATILLSDHAVLIGDNNTGKTTVLEALDLALGPDRLNRTPPVDEHDFYQGRYLANTRQ
jgi:hypothetical protein